ncbi:uncharacterized protein I303_104432 [Kwoniella dejecticola CBS 10117]|uniref:Uncharacterized protein n=1 Tax=Kwoniella dejecticola CBS 10117 TaxID=1296121 RepID=A0A1A6A5C4_9TREE|nr:uncharacterized protein I303_04589 [Kwoniella dejecticola CBS 10117]OBR85256.1 hypothetical protein I303_04589 [Kwoniella dejecticola CBS 10117]
MADLPAQLRPSTLPSDPLLAQHPSLTAPAVLNEIDTNSLSSLYLNLSSDGDLDSHPSKDQIDTPGIPSSTMGNTVQSQNALPHLPPSLDLSVIANTEQQESSPLTNPSGNENQDSPNATGRSGSQKRSNGALKQQQPQLMHPLPKGPPCNTPEVIEKAIKKKKTRASLTSTPDSTFASSLKAGIAGKGLNLREHRDSLDVVVKGEKTNLEWPWEDDDDDRLKGQGEKVLMKERKLSRKLEEKCLTSAPSVKEKKETPADDNQVGERTDHLSSGDCLVNSENIESSSASNIDGNEATADGVTQHIGPASQGTMNTKEAKRRLWSAQITADRAHHGLTNGQTLPPAYDQYPQSLSQSPLKSIDEIATEIMTESPLTYKTATHENSLQCSILNQPVHGQLRIMQNLSPNNDTAVAGPSSAPSVNGNGYVAPAANGSYGSTHPTVHPFAVNAGPVTLNMLLSEARTSRPIGLAPLRIPPPIMPTISNPSPQPEPLSGHPEQSATASGATQQKEAEEPIILRRLIQTKDIIDSLQQQIRNLEVQRDWCYGSLQWTNVVADKLVPQTSYPFICSSLAKLCGRYIQGSLPLGDPQSTHSFDSMERLLINLAVSVDCTPPNMQSLPSCPAMESIFYRVVRVIMRDYDPLSSIEIHANEKNRILVPSLPTQDPCEYFRPPDILWVFAHIGDPQFYNPFLSAIRTALWSCPTTRRGVALLLLLGRIQGSRMTLGINNQPWARNLGLILENNGSRLPDPLNEDSTTNMMSHLSFGRVDEGEIEGALRFIKRVRDEEIQKKDAMLKTYIVEAKGGPGAKRKSEVRSTESADGEGNEKENGDKKRRNKKRKTS